MTRGVVAAFKFLVLFTHSRRLANSKTFLAGNGIELQNDFTLLALSKQIREYIGRHSESKEYSALANQALINSMSQSQRGSEDQTILCVICSNSNTSQSCPFPQLATTCVDPKPEAAPLSDFLGLVNEIFQTEYSNPHFHSAEVAKRIGISRMQLYRKLKSFGSKTITELLMEFRVDKAFAMLKSGKHQRVQDVAKLCGFSTPSYFATVLQNLTQRKPSKVLKNSY